MPGFAQQSPPNAKGPGVPSHQTTPSANALLEQQEEKIAPLSALSSDGVTNTPAPTSAAKKSPLVPTPEQQIIYSQCKPPGGDGPTIVRITAGAGSGKTTTILNLAEKAAKMGHTHIVYVTFSKAAATDGHRRIMEIIQNSGNPNPPLVQAQTLHACAMNLLSKHRKEKGTGDELEGRLWDDQRLQRFILETCKHDIERFLDYGARQEINKGSNADKKGSMFQAAERQIIFFVYKTLTSFCQSNMTEAQLQDANYRKRNYYPATKYHDKGGDGEKAGFPTMVYRTRVGSYADMAWKVWETSKIKNVRTYDFEMKRAQLLELRIPGTLLLVDESQDLDGCQTDWIAKQATAGKGNKNHVYFVGDAAQTIYSFRGAKSRYMMGVPNAVDCSLTKSWRFGSEIAKIANTVLFTKLKSPQTTGNSYHPIWK